MKHFEDGTLYRPSDPKLAELLPYSTLATYRHEGRGPRYIKVGARIFYRGEDLNAWLATLVVEPPNAA